VRLGGFTLMVLLLCAGCAGTGIPKPTLTYAPELLDGRALFGHEVQPAPKVDLLAVNPAMQAFVDNAVSDAQLSSTRFRRLMTQMIESGFFINQYDRSATYSAAQTFAVRKGNCLAYTNLFVALARAAGLQAEYQVVGMAPMWDVESGYLIRNNHINVLLDSIRVPGYSDTELTVDFNLIEADPYTPRRVVSDAYAASMFYANVAVDNLHKGNHEAMFAYLKRAALTEPTNIDVWNNLGALYSIEAEDKLAEQAYRLAMQLEPRDKTAISGLAKSLRKQGREEEAEDYSRLAWRYQARNPYYHYALAEQAYRNAAFDEALRAINQAIELKRNNPRFYALRAATAEQLGDDDLAAISARLQRKHAKSRGEAAYARVFN
jgi:Flp pilus assembly protein TadD